MKKKILSVMTILILILSVNCQVFASTVYTEGYFYYHKHEGYVSICGYFGDEDTVTVPDSIAGLPVSVIEEGALDGIKNVTLPDTIMNDSQSTGEKEPTTTPGITTPDTDTSNTNTPEQSETESKTDGENQTESNNTTTKPSEDAELGQNEQVLDPVKDKSGLSVNEKGALIYIDPQGQTTVLDDMQTYTMKETDTGASEILDAQGNAVRIEDGAVKNEKGDTIAVLDEMGQVQNKDDSTKNNKLPIFILSVVVLVLIIATFIIYKKRR